MIAITMILVFAISVSGAFLTTLLDQEAAHADSSSQRQAPIAFPASLKAANGGILHFNIQAGWTDDAKIQAWWAERLNIGSCLAYVDPKPPYRQLIAFPLRTNKPEKLNEVSERIASMLTAVTSVSKLINPRIEHYPSSDKQLTSMLLTAQSGTEDPNKLQFHGIAVITTDEQNFWVFYLTDTLQKGHQPERAALSDMAALSIILATARYEPPA